MFLPCRNLAFSRTIPFILTLRTPITSKSSTRSTNRFIQILFKSCHKKISSSFPLSFSFHKKILPLILSYFLPILTSRNLISKLRQLLNQKCRKTSSRVFRYHRKFLQRSKQTRQNRNLIYHYLI